MLALGDADNADDAIDEVGDVGDAAAAARVATADKDERRAAILLQGLPNPRPKPAGALLRSPGPVASKLV